jgi:hypothetical protein
MTPHSMPQQCAPRLEGSATAVAEDALSNDSEAEGSEPHASTQKTSVHNEEEFFNKYRVIVPKQEWEEFRSVISRKRNFQVRIVDEKGDLHVKDNSWTSATEIAEDLTRLKHGVLLIEDADFDCILALDFQFNLDPLFLLSYTGLRKDVEFCHIPTPHGKNHKFNTGKMGNWYRIDCSMTRYGLVEPDNLKTPAWQMTSELWKRGNASNNNRPWCQEACGRRLFAHTGW